MVRVLDIFAGGGGSSSGAAMAGAEIAAAIDMDPVATRTFQSNFPLAHVVNAKLEDVDVKALRRKIGEIDLLLASPECTNHSCAKGAAPRNEASRATAMHAITYAKAFTPRWIIMENVIHMRPWSRYGELKEELEALGYQVSEQVLDASDFGVAQSRRRLFIICDREASPAFVTPTRRTRRKTVRSILDAHGKWKASPLYSQGRAKPTLERAERAFRELGSKQSSFLIVYYGSDGSGGWQPLDRPLRTITTIDRFALVEPSEKGPTIRMLQVPELKRAMGFENSYELSEGTRRDKVRLLGNGVCPPVMREIVSSLLANV